MFFDFFCFRDINSHPTQQHIKTLKQQKWAEFEVAVIYNAVTQLQVKSSLLWSFEL